VDGKNYWTFEYDLEAPGYGVSAWATVAIGNGRVTPVIKLQNLGQLVCSNLNKRGRNSALLLPGRYYTLIVTANERRWSRLRNKLKVVADSFKISDLTA
jgi:hypothetical protein